MIIWLDNQLPPALALGRSDLVRYLRRGADLNLQRASDIDIFKAARSAGVVVFTKDADCDARGPTGPSARSCW